MVAAAEGEEEEEGEGPTGPEDALKDRGGGGRTDDVGVAVEMKLGVTSALPLMLGRGERERVGEWEQDWVPAT